MTKNKIALFSLTTLMLTGCSTPLSTNSSRESSIISSRESTSELVPISSVREPSSSEETSPYSTVSSSLISSAAVSPSSETFSESASSSREKTPEEKVIDYVNRNGGNALISRTVVEQSIQINCRLNSSLNISGSGSENKRITQTYSVSVEYTFDWDLRSGYCTCKRHYYTSNWQTNEIVDETTNVTAYLKYAVGGRASIDRYNTTGASKWESTVKTALNTILQDCATQIGYIA